METVRFGTTCTQPGSPRGPSDRPSSSVLREKQLRELQTNRAAALGPSAPPAMAGLTAWESGGPRSSTGHSQVRRRHPGREDFLMTANNGSSQLPGAGWGGSR